MANGPGSRDRSKRKPRSHALPACLTLREVTAQQKRLEGALAAGSAAIDASAVALIDTAGLQLLLAAFAGGGVRYEAPSATLCEAAARLGLGAALGIETGSPGPPSPKSAA